MENIEQTTLQQKVLDEMLNQNIQQEENEPFAKNMIKNIKHKNLLDDNIFAYAKENKKKYCVDAEFHIMVADMLKMYFNMAYPKLLTRYRNKEIGIEKAIDEHAFSYVSCYFQYNFRYLKQLIIEAIENNLF